MSRASRRAVPLLAVLGAAAVVFGATGCGDTRPEGADPSSPQDVVQAYVDRLSSGDRTGAGELLTETGRRNGGAPIGSSSIRGFSMRPPAPVPDNRSNGRHVAQAVSIWTDFTRVGETDPTLGRAAWDFILVKENPGDPWRIDDQGLG